MYNPCIVTVCLRTGNFRQKHDSHGIGIKFLINP